MIFDALVEIIGDACVESPVAAFDDVEVPIGVSHIFTLYSRRGERRIYSKFILKASQDPSTSSGFPCGELQEPSEASAALGPPSPVVQALAQASLAVLGCSLMPARSRKGLRRANLRFACSVPKYKSPISGAFVFWLPGQDSLRLRSG